MGTLTAGVTPAATADHAHASIRRRARAVHTSPAIVRSPIVTTITKIVGVVPTFVWALIGALALLALMLAVRTRLAAVRARRLERQRRELLADVGLLQAALLPAPPARLGPVGASVAYRPADGPGAGGDFYDVFALDDGRIGVIVGDISGHGRPALPHTALVRYTLRAYFEAGLSPREAIRTAGSVLDRQLGGSFATVVAAAYHPRERTLTYACAGHPPPLVLGGRFGEDVIAGDPGSVQSLVARNPRCVRWLVPVTAGTPPPLGAGMPTGARQSVVSIPGRAQLCFHTDGLTEARVGNRGELFGPDRLARALAELGPSASAPELLDRVAQQTASRPDDMAACLLTIDGDESPPVALLEEAALDSNEAVSERTQRFLLACGAQPAELAGLMRSAAALAARAGAVLIEVHTPGRCPRVVLRPDNVAPLRAPQMTAIAAGR